MHLLDFTFVGLPQSVQSDQGPIYVGTHIASNAPIWCKLIQILSVYSPELQVALERFYQTLKIMLQAYCVENNCDWD